MASRVRCCVGTAPTPTANSAEAERLSLLRPSQLSRTAAQRGVADADIEEAEDSDDPKAALVELCLGAAPTAGGAHAALRAELGAPPPPPPKGVWISSRWLYNYTAG